MLMVTTDGVPGHVVDRAWGLVSGQANGREGAEKLMVEAAERAGANAILAVRWDSLGGPSGPPRQGWAVSHFVYGTPVRIRASEG